MEQLIALLKDGHARTIELLAMELHTSREDVLRQLEYLENMGIIRRVSMTAAGCGSCSGCGTHGKSDGPACKGCMPENGFQNMGEMWEVV
ncbi:MAG: Lrp/AsnC family transcriptional regulator [Blautia sp.]|nr:Lrp/AsnC family transcriptional regulator [Blautia sp.]